MRILILFACTALCAAAAGPAAARAPVPAVPLQCVIALKGKPAPTAADLCGAFARALSARTGRRIIVAAAGAALPPSDAVRLELGRPRGNALSAGLSGRIGGRKVLAGPLTIDVMDRALRQADVDKLAQTLAMSLKNG
ncbi:MAG: hypothetical protein ACKOQ3_05005 [Novosphingobium sp.]